MGYSTKKLTLKYGDYILDIPNGNLGWCRKIMEAGLSQIDSMLSHTDRIFVLRFDCHASGFSSDNKQIGVFRRRLFKSLRRYYPDLLIGYLWVREQEKSKHQHYHFALMVDANRVPTANVVLNEATRVWERLTGIHPHIPKHPYYLVRLGHKQGFIDAASRLSYLAKSRGKGYRPAQTKDYGASRIKVA